jgi:hypothetical protein
VYNRDETTNVVTTSSSFSPSPVADIVQFCGEAGVWGIGQNIPAGGSTAVLGSGIPNVAQTVGVFANSSGWLKIATTGLGGKGLPVVGASFSKASSDPAKTYGWSTSHTIGRVATFAY